jgi:preprotein translocase subunit SecA
LEPQRPKTGLRYSAPSVDGADEPVTSYDRGGATGPGGGDPNGAALARNAPCWCGSGRKYKRCHGDPTRRN